MKIFSILDQSEAASKDNAFIFYDKAANRGYIEISRKCDENALPAALMLLKRKGILTINNEVTQKFIESRVVPRDRQNMPEIMAELHMKEYDPWFLFEYLHGRCSQDDCFVKNINEDSLPDEIKKRLEKHISKAYALDDFRLFLIFQNGKTGIIDIEKIRSSNRHFRRIFSEKNFSMDSLLKKMDSRFIGTATLKFYMMNFMILQRKVILHILIFQNYSGQIFVILQRPAKKCMFRGSGLPSRRNWTLLRKLLIA